MFHLAQGTARNADKQRWVDINCFAVLKSTERKNTSYIILLFNPRGCPCPVSLRFAVYHFSPQTRDSKNFFFVFLCEWFGTLDPNGIYRSVLSAGYTSANCTHHRQPCKNSDWPSPPLPFQMAYPRSHILIRQTQW